MERQLRFDKINTTLRPAMSAAAPPPADCRTRQHMDTSPIGLPNEIIEEIVSKIDVKSLVRFKSVSKSWQSVISRILESKLSENQNKFFFWATYDRFYLIRLEKDGKFRTEPLLGYPLEEPEPLTFPVCSCNGLVLLRSDEGVMLWNPFIGKHMTIPFYAKKPPQYCHLYHDSTTDDHKIVFVYDAWEGRYVVYSCKNGDWGKMQHFPYELIDETAMVAFVDGSFYLHHDDDDKIMCFDARDGKLHKVQLPNEVRGRNELVLAKVSGRLCLYFWDEDGKLLHLWVMEENQSFDKRWRKVMGMEKANPNVWGLIPVCLSNEEDVVLWGIVLEDEKSVTKHFLYNLSENSSFREIQFHWKYPVVCFPYSATLYMPSSNISV